MKTKRTLLAALLLGLGSLSALQAQQADAFRHPFPSNLNVAHTWNRSLVKKAGQVIGAGLSTRWGAGKDIVAGDFTVVDPAALAQGDAAETAALDNRYSQSPYLTAELGVEMIKGLQTGGQTRAYVGCDAREKTATYVSPYQRIVKEATAAGLAGEGAGRKATAWQAGDIPADGANEELQRTALQVAQESITLLRNAGGVLPIDTSWVKSVFVCGDKAVVDAVLPELRAAVPCRFRSAWEPVVSLPMVSPTRLPVASACDLILVLGSTGDDELATELQLTGRPVVRVALGLRDLEEERTHCAAALLQAWTPGQAGPKAIASVLAGTYNPGGKLTVAVPGFALGHGLSYTTFCYHDLRLEPAVIGTDGDVTVRFKVTNTGTRDGGEVVQVYVDDEQASTALHSPKLEACKRTNIKAGATKELKFTIRRRNMELLNAQGKWVIESGFFTVRVGGASDDIRLQGRFEVR